MSLRSRLADRLEERIQIDWFHFGVTSGAFSDSMYGMRLVLRRLPEDAVVAPAGFFGPPLAAATWQPWGRYWPPVACLPIEDSLPVVHAPRGGIRYLVADEMAPFGEAEFAAVQERMRRGRKGPLCPPCQCGPDDCVVERARR